MPAAATKRQNQLVLERGLEILTLAREAGTPLYALGGLAVYLECPDLRDEMNELRPPLADVDLFSTRSHLGSLVELFVERLGYSENEQWRMLFGYQRRIFYSPDEMTVEVFLDQLRFCQDLDPRPRLPSDSLSLEATDLFLSRIQRIPLTAKDVIDLKVLLAAHGPTSGSHRIDTERVIRLASRSWRWWRTLSENLPRLREPTPGGTAALDTAAEAAAGLEDAIANAPKSLGWRLRALWGDRIAWFREVE